MAANQASTLACPPPLPAWPLLYPPVRGTKKVLTNTLDLVETLAKETNTCHTQTMSVTPMPAALPSDALPRVTALPAQAVVVLHLALNNGDSSDSSKKMFAAGDSGDSSKEMPTAGDSSDSSKKISSVSDSSDSSEKISIVGDSGDSSKKILTVGDSSDSSKKMPTAGDSSDSSKKIPTVGDSSDSFQILA
jgi:hypothetical protein